MRNGSFDQLWPSTGTTSVCPDNIIPGLSVGPIVAKRLAFRPSSARYKSAPIPALGKELADELDELAVGIAADGRKGYEPVQELERVHR